jgi:hypothetical protein
VGSCSARLWRTRTGVPNFAGFSSHFPSGVGQFGRNELWSMPCHDQCIDLEFVYTSHNLAKLANTIFSPAPRRRTK